MNLILITAFIILIAVLLQQWLRSTTKKQAILLIPEGNGIKYRAQLRQLQNILGETGYKVKLVYRPSESHFKLLLWYYLRFTAERLLVFFVGEYVSVNGDECIVLGDKELFSTMDFLNSVDGRDESTNKSRLTMIALISNYSPQIPPVFDIEVIPEKDRKKRLNKIASICLLSSEDRCLGAFNTLLEQLYGKNGELGTFQNVSVFLTASQEAQNVKVTAVPTAAFYESVL